MKKVLYLLTALSLVASCGNQDAAGKNDQPGSEDTVINTLPPGTTDQPDQTAETDPGQVTRIEWIGGTTKDLGKLEKDKPVDVIFRFRNNGDQVLVIENVTAGCGCTIPEKPQQPFPPGEQGEIKAVFNGSGHGTISKTVTVTANTSPEKVHTLTFTGEIRE